MHCGIKLIKFTCEVHYTLVCIEIVTKLIFHLLINVKDHYVYVCCYIFSSLICLIIIEFIMLDALMVEKTPYKSAHELNHLAINHVKRRSEARLVSLVKSDLDDL